jgi:hypothetical protein
LTDVELVSTVHERRSRYVPTLEDVVVRRRRTRVR